MKFLTILSVFFTFTAQAQLKTLSLDEKIEIAKSRCAPQTADEPVLYSSTFSFNMSMEKVDALYPEVYQSDDRLQHRVGYKNDSKTFVSFKDDKDKVIFPEDYIKSIILHIENSLRLNYVKYIFFPDMGHSHLFIPLEYYEKEMSGRGSVYDALTLAYKAPGLKTLYHTAEQISLLDEDKKVFSDRYLQWRFYTRNPTIDKQGNIEILSNYDNKGSHNTVRDLKGYRFFTGFNISANKNGCFPFEDSTGQIQYFDLSAWDLAYKPGDGDDEDPGLFYNHTATHLNY